ncbi:MAG: myo-inosose-2 dehydratase [Alphaproteobacteria bacterium]
MRSIMGIAPIAWSNDDLPELGGDTPLETCLREARAAGFAGVETGGKFPPTAAELGPLLTAHDLRLASGWYSGTLLDNDLESEKERARGQLSLFRELDAPCLVYGEASGTIQNRRDVALARRRRLGSDEIASYGEKLTRFAEFCAEEEVPLAFHHHMGTVIETEEELDTLMAHTGEAVGLTLDSGHMVFAAGDLFRVIERHGARIVHIHTKDVRAEVLSSLDWEVDSFLTAVLRGAFTVPGDGSIDFAAVVARLYAVGYEGWFVVEAEQDPKLAPPYEYACKGYAALSGALADAGYDIES